VSTKLPAGIERRTFLERLATGGLVLAVGPAGVRHFNTISELGAAAADAFEPAVYLSIAESGIVTVICHRSEMGQGSTTTLVMTLADELEADWTKVRLEQAIGDAKYGDQNTDGSTSIRNGTYMKFREVGAMARLMLAQAAAAEWNVPVNEVAAHNSVVTHAKTRRTLGYGALVARARTLPVPTTALLKVPTAFRFIGKKVNGVKPIQQHAMVTGKAVYGQDATMPGMKIAVVQRPPVYGARVVKFDAAAALAVPGVEKVIEIPGAAIPSAFNPLGGVAVIASSTWAAISGRAKLNISWSESPNDSYDSAAYRTELEASVRAASGGVTVRDAGNVEAALSSAAKAMTAEYYVPHLSQAPMEPPAALANVTGNKCEAWACTQDPQAAQATVAALLKLPKENVTIHVTLLGGGFGRKSKPDFIAEAAWLSQQLVLRPGNCCRKSGELGEDGIGGRRPREGARGAVVTGHVVHDALDEGANRLKRAASDRLPSNQPEPDLHLIEPRAVGRREMHVVARPLGQPRADLGMLVGGVVVHDQVDLQPRGNLGVEMPKECEKLLVPVPALALREDVAPVHIERREERGGAVAEVVVRDALDVAEPHRQQWGRALQRLDLALLINGQHEGVVRGIQVEPDDIADLLDEERIRREFEARAAVRLHAEEREVPLDGALADAGLLGGAPGTPVRRVGGLRPQHRSQQPRHLIVVVGPRPARSRGIVQPRQAQGAKAPSPVPDHGGAQPHFRADLAIRQTRGGEQDHLRPPHQPGRQRPRVGDVFQLRPGLGRQRDFEGTGATERHGGSGKGMPEDAASLMPVTNGSLH
jgi:hypothetical protein